MQSIQRHASGMMSSAHGPVSTLAPAPASIRGRACPIAPSPLPVMGMGIAERLSSGSSGSRARPLSAMSARDLSGFQRPNSSPAVPARKNLVGNCIVTMTSEKTVGCTVASAEHLQEYMNHAAIHFAGIGLPMGGKITRVDDSHVELVIPKIQLFDVWLQPRALASLRAFNERIEFTSATENCGLVGSHHVKDFKLDERFNLDVRITFHWKNTATPGGASAIQAKGNIMVEVDIPPPFSFMPKPVLTTAGNTALAASLSMIMDSFVSKLSTGYTSWAKTALHAPAPAHHAPAPVHHVKG